MQEPKNNLKEHPDLYKRSIKGGCWVFAIRLATQSLGFVKGVIVFNILLRENLELIYVANLLMAALVTFSESGFRAALVQKKGDIVDYLDTAWVIGILRGILLFAAIYFIAPLFASFKVDPEKTSLAISVIRIMGVCFLIRGFQNIGTVYFQKELQFHKTFWLTMAGTIAEIVISISLLLIYRSVWAVVFARLLSVAVNLLMSYVMCSYRPKFHFVPEKARELWKFGKWLFGGNIVGYLLNEGDDWFVMFYFLPNPIPFNLYRGAYRFANMPATHISQTISKVSFPAYSKIQHDIPRLREAYLKVLQITAMISVPVAFLIFTLGPDFVNLFLTSLSAEEAKIMISVVQVLACYGLLRSLGSTRGPLFQAMGKPYANFHFHCVRIVLLVASIYPLTNRYGIIGTACAILLINIIVEPFVLLMTQRLIKCPFVDMLRRFFVPSAASIVMALCLLVLKTYVFNGVSYLSFFALAICAVGVYASTVWILALSFGISYGVIFKEQLNLLRRK